MNKIRSADLGNRAIAERDAVQLLCMRQDILYFAFFAKI